MGWLSWPRDAASGATAAAEAQQTQDVLASIFAPSHRALPPPAPQTTATTTARAAPAAASTEWSASESTNTTASWVRRLWQPRSGPAPLTSVADASTPAPVSFSSSPSTATTSAAVSWETLPSCPVAGYELTRQGLVDRLHKPPRPLTPPELRDLIHELTAVEQRAKHQVDEGFGRHMANRGMHGIELLVSPFLFLTAAYLMTWKTAQLYRSAVPQDSVVFTRLLALLRNRRRLPAGQRELLAQRHQRLMRATNARVTLAFLAGAAVFAVAWTTRPARDVIETAQDVLTTKELAAFQQHAESSLRWCWFVYYHHPAYASASSRRDSRSGRDAASASTP